MIQFDQILLTPSQLSLLKGFVYNSVDGTQNPADAEALCSFGLVQPIRNDFGGGNVVFTGRYYALPVASAYLNYLDQKAKQEAERQADRRFNKQVSVATLLVSAASFVLGLVVEYFAGVVELISKLLGNWVK